MKANARHPIAAEAAPRAARDRPIEAPALRTLADLEAMDRQPWKKVLAIGTGAVVAGGLAMGLVPLMGAPAAAAAAAALGALTGVAGCRWVVAGRHKQRGGGIPLAAAEPAPVGAARPLFLELSAREWSRARRYGTGAALLLIEIDRHELLQQACGAAAVDRVMADMLRLTAPTLRGADVLTRYSPVQMAVFLAQADALGALDVAERIRERTERLEMAGARADASAASSMTGRVLQSTRLPVSLTVSIGVATLHPAHTQLQSLIDDASSALDVARSTGGNCVRAAPVESATGGDTPQRPVPRREA